MISPSNWEQIRALFHSALARAPDERAAFLRAQSSDDEILREVASLLAAHADADALLDAAGRHEADAPPARGRPALTLASGAQLGPYVVVSLLGAGAMGEVYRARDTNRLLVEVHQEGLGSGQAVRGLNRQTARLKAEAFALAGIASRETSTILLVPVGVFPARVEDHATGISLRQHRLRNDLHCIRLAEPRFAE